MSAKIAGFAISHGPGASTKDGECGEPESVIGCLNY